MIEYVLSPKNHHNQYLDIEASFKTNGQDKITVQLPAWRPGRYELGNFAQNVQKWHVYDENGKRISSRKLAKDIWEIPVQGTEKVRITYNYYATKLDAGSTYIDEDHLYVNPVNCLIFIPERINEPCKIRLEIPGNHQIASSLKFDESRVAIVEDYHRLADSPLIAAPDLMHKTYETGNCKFHIWIKGLSDPDWDRITNDFKKFSQVQIDVFGSMPVDEYHFLFELPATKYYHGVEHLASTVICLGPGYKLMDKELYIDFLGISSHELFHSWNVKAIRPIEMMPYNYSAENYTNLGYVAEGVTTYYGDLMLLRADVYDWKQYVEEWLNFLYRHFHVFGFLYQTLAESSFDTWLDGYKPGIPDRKVNMYVKGLMVAFLIDVSIRKETDNSFSLDDVMRELYNNFGKTSRGYSEQDYLGLINKVSGKDHTELFNKYVWGLEPIEPALIEAFNYMGCELLEEESPTLHERYYGFKVKEDANKVSVVSTAPGSPADLSGLGLGDEIIAINSIQVSLDFNDLVRISHDNDIHITYFRNRQLMELRLKKTDKKYYPAFKISKLAEASGQQKQNFKAWAGVPF